MVYRNYWTLDALVWCWTVDAWLWTLDYGRGHWFLDAGRWSLDAGLWTLDDDDGLWTLNARLWTCRSTARSWSASGASHKPAFMGFLTIIHTCLPCPLSGWGSPCVFILLMIELKWFCWRFFFGGGRGCEYGFSNVGVGAILGNGFQGQN